MAFLLSISGGWSERAVARSGSSIFDVDCSAKQRATGCMAPYKTCETGVRKNIVATCMMSAKFQRCPDFGWEKCCAANCYLRAGKNTSKMGQCMEECGSSAASAHYWPKAPKKRRSSGH
jgi:hypothetical protein